MNNASAHRTVLADELASPCINVCEMDAGSGLCVGCLRTLDEIAAWGALDSNAKRAVLAALPSRRIEKANRQE